MKKDPMDIELRLEKEKEVTKYQKRFMEIANKYLYESNQPG
jgi:hypothetical protein